MNGLFAEEDENTFYFSRSESSEILGTHYPQSFFLDDAEWPTVEHYFQAMKFDDPAYRERVRLSPTPQKARKLGRTRLKKIRKDWKKVRTTVMTRALYIRARTHEKFRNTLLDSLDQRLVESSNYDYFWGCGRDRRGENNYGKALMNVRKKLKLELSEQA